MAYNFTAEARRSALDSGIVQCLKRVALIEWFSMEAPDDAAAYGISVPLRVLEAPGLESELASLMTCLIVDHGCEVTDLYTGDRVTPEGISGLFARLSR